MQEFCLQFDSSKINPLRIEYEKDLEAEKKALKAGKNIADGNYNADNLKTIVSWKSKRNVALLEENSEVEIADALSLAINAKTERSAIAVLCGLNGVEIPVASAIMTAISPCKYTIIDFHALQSLGITRRSTSYSFDYYLSYLHACRKLAEEYKIELRTLDHALWQWSKNKDNGNPIEELSLEHK